MGVFFRYHLDESEAEQKVGFVTFHTCKARVCWLTALLHLDHRKSMMITNFHCTHFIGVGATPWQTCPQVLTHCPLGYISRKERGHILSRKIYKEPQAPLLWDLKLTLASP